MTLEPLKAHTPTLSTRSLSFKQSLPLHTPGPKTPASINPTRRQSLVYVEVPPSPFYALSTPKHSRNHSGVIQPLSEKKINMNVSVDLPVLAKNSVSKKRKLADDDVSGRKKYKRAQEAIKYSDEFPQGYFYCHQCHRRRVATEGVQCTFIVMNRCPKVYCDSCMRAWYSQDGSSVRSGSSEESIDRGRHVLDAGYFWKCPNCNDFCKCFRCRRERGLEPIGKNGKFVDGMEKIKPKKSKSQTTTGQRLSIPTSKPVVEIISMSHIPQDTLTKKPRAPRKRRAVPEPNWEGVPTELNRIDAEDRFLIREFVLRFAPLMSFKSIKIVDELDEFDGLSEQYLKSIVINLLDLIAADAETPHQKLMKNCVKKITAGSLSAKTIWSYLSELRDSIPSSVIRLPDPCTSEDCESRTRSGIILHAKHLVPALVGLVEAAIQGPSVREEIENGLADVKQCNQEYWAATRDENDKLQAKKDKVQQNNRLSVAEKTKQIKNLTAEHKAAVNILEQEHEMKIQSWSPRFSPIGKDAEGRVYYVSTAYNTKKIPSEAERASLVKWSWFLAVWGKGSSDGSSKPIDEDEDEDANEEKWWGFSDPKEIVKLAKWIEAKENLKATKSTPTNEPAEVDQRLNVDNSPPSADANGSISDSEGENERSASKHGSQLGGEKRASRKELKKLVKDLLDYAEFLTWRIGSGSEKVAAKSQSSRATPVENITATSSSNGRSDNFYGKQDQKIDGQ